MEIVHSASALDEMLQPLRLAGKTIGFVPTMGALHEGHATLVKRCVAENDLCVVSIFVNPTQFNNMEDLKHYPRTPEKDHLLLESIGTDIIFTPSVEEIYPEPDNRVFDFGMLDKVMEGAFRPGHFNGVAQVVSKLFTLVRPGIAYFGEKDFQQLAIVREMVRQLQLSVVIVGVPIVREAGGLALSSRNQRLTEEQKINASEIYRVLRESAAMRADHTPKQVTDYVIRAINNVPGLSVEYYEIVDGNTLRLISSWETTAFAVGCIAVFCGEVRLIDNIRYN